MEKGILEVGEYVLCSEVYGGKVLCEVMEISEDDSICYLIPERHFVDIGPRNDKPRPFDVSTVQYINMPKELPKIIEGTFVYHEEYFGGHVELYVLKAIPKCGIFTTCNITNDPSGLNKRPFSYEGVLFERKPVENELSKLHQRIYREVGSELEKDKIRFDTKMMFDNIHPTEQMAQMQRNEDFMAVQVRFLTDNTLCDLRKKLGEAYENGIRSMVFKNGKFELCYDTLTVQLIEKLKERIIGYTRQEFPELIIEE